MATAEFSGPRKEKSGFKGMFCVPNALSHLSMSLLYISGQLTLAEE